ncbi:MAG: hypothetical protein AAGE52_24485 [Myxococcota bacterium]
MGLRVWLGLALLAACSVPRSGIGSGDAAGNTCTRNSECEDGIPCTENRCTDGSCQVNPRDEDCTAEPGGMCLPTSGLADLEGCVYEACDTETCEATQTNAELCEVGACDGELCVGVSTCAEGESCCGDGTCRACDDNNPCTTDTCEGDECVNTPVVGLLCNDDDACTVGDICGDDGSCVGTTCEEMGDTLRCGPTGCVGCVTDADCADSVTDWSPCAFGAPNTAAVCTGTQQRTVTTGTCNSDSVCIFTDRIEDRGCNQPSGSNVRCRTDTVTAFGACDYTGVCDESASRTRTRTIFRCNGATCMPRNGNNASDTQACTRDTDGAECGGDVFGPWSGCSYSGFCDETGSRSRTVTERVCGSGACTNRAAGMQTQVGPCTRSRDGQTCDGGTTCGGFSACNYTDVCDEMATRSRTCMDRTCSADMCQVTSRTDTQNCNRDTDGDSCGSTMFGGWGSCMRASGTTCTGMQSRTVVERNCGSSSCMNDPQPNETRSCDISSGTSCGTGTSMTECVRPNATSCVGETTTTTTNPTCNGSGTCNSNEMVTTSGSCNVADGESCGTSLTCDGGGNCCPGDPGC